jgi:flagellin
MAFSINTNTSAMAAIRSLSMISSDLTKTQSRVETGLRINKANDDPAVFAIAQNMRADLNGMTAVKDSLAFGGAAVTVARDAATKVSNELATLKQTVTQGQQQGLDKTQIDAQITNSLANIDAYVRAATFNRVNLLIDPADAAANSVDYTSLDVMRDISGNTTAVASQNLSVQALGLAGLTWDQGQMEVVFDDSMAFANGDVVNITRDDGSQVIFEFVDGATALTSQPVADDPTTTGATQNEQVDVVAVVYDAATEAPLAGLQKLMAAIGGEGFGAALTTVQSGASAGQPRLVVSGNFDVAASVAATTIAAGATPGVVNASANTAIAAVDAAVDIAGAALGALGATLRQVEGLQSFASQLNDSLKEGLGSIVDADLAEESAKLTSMQTKQQLAVQSLSIANQASQSLLGLFR